MSTTASTTDHLSKWIEHIMLVVLRDHLSASYESIPPRSTMDQKQLAFFQSLGKTMRENCRAIADNCGFSMDEVRVAAQRVQRFYATA